MKFAHFEEWIFGHILWSFPVKEQPSKLNVPYHSVLKRKVLTPQKLKQERFSELLQPLQTFYFHFSLFSPRYLLLENRKPSTYKYKERITY